MPIDNRIVDTRQPARKRRRFRSVLLAHLALGAVVPVVLLGWATFITATIGIRDLAVRDVEQSMDKAADLVNRELASMLDAYVTLNLAYGLLRFGAVDEEPISAAVARDQRMQRFVLSAARSFQLRGVRLFMDRADGTRVRGTTSTLNSLAHLPMHLTEFEGVEDARQASIVGPYDSALTAAPGGSTEQLSLSGPLIQGNLTSGQSGWMILDKNPDRIRSLLMSIATAYDGSAAVIDETGRLVMEIDSQNHFDRIRPESYHQTAQAAQLLEDGLYVSTRPLPANQWSLVSVLPQSFIIREGLRVSRFGVVAIVASTLLAVALLRSFARYMGTRLDPIRAAIEAGPINETDLLPPLPVHGDPDRPDEIDQLALSYNDLRHRLDALVERVYRAEQESLRQKLSALQSQINPHFIYNTLEGIQSNIVLSRPDAAIQIVRELSQLLRTGLSHGADELPLRVEIEMVKRFLKLEELVYGVAYELVVQADESLLEMPLARFTLQPIVENSVVHGFAKADCAGGRTITIVGELDGCAARVCVTDNGLGVAEEELTRLNTLLDSSGQSTAAFGLSNVHARLRLRHGPSAGLKLFQPEGGGFGVELRIPEDTT